MVVTVNWCFHRSRPEASSIFTFHILFGRFEDILHHQGKKIIRGEHNQLLVVSVFREK